MSVRKSCVATIGLLALLGSSARAQGFVPGGWSPRFSYQSLNGPEIGPGGYRPFPGGTGPDQPSDPYGGYPPYGYAPYSPIYPPPGAFAGPAPSYGIYPPATPPALVVRSPSGTTNATGGLIGVIRRSTRRPGR